MACTIEIVDDVHSLIDHIHPAQPPLFQFGQIRYKSPTSLGIIPLAPHPCPVILFFTSHLIGALTTMLIAKLILRNIVMGTIIRIMGSTHRAYDDFNRNAFAPATSTFGSR